MSELLIRMVKPRAEDSHILVDDKRYKIIQDNGDTNAGLQEAMNTMFRALRNAKVTELISHFTSSASKVKSAAEIATISDMLIKVETERGWFKGDTLAPHVLLSIDTVLGLIAWKELRSEGKIFKKQHSSLRNCVVCNQSQYGQVTGHANLSMTDIVRWPSHYCLNPDCFSHELNRMINPSYTVPKEAYEAKKESSGLGKIVEKALEKRDSKATTGEDSGAGLTHFPK